MDIKQSIELIKRFNQWRRGEVDEFLTMDELGLHPTEIGKALDALVNFAEVTVAAQELFVDKQSLGGEVIKWGDLSAEDYKNQITKGDFVNLYMCSFENESPVCCHTCSNQGPIKQVNSLTIKCDKCGSGACNRAIWHKERCSD